MNDARLIALYSPAPQQGKSTVAKHLIENHGFEQVKFAMPLKAMTCVFLMSAGIAKDDLHAYVEGNKKETQIKGLPKGITSRHLQRTLGCEWGRDNVAKNVWVDLALLKTKALLAEGKSVVIDDMRFPNEYEAVLKNGGEVWRIVRSKKKFKSDGHSEGLLEGRFWDLSVLNDKSIEVLERGISAVVQLPDPLGQLRRT